MEEIRKEYEEEIRNHYKIETILMDLLRKIDQYNKEGKKYKIDLNKLEVKINDISSNKKN